MTPPTDNPDPLDHARIELHSHTFLSDGELSPMELCSRARDLGLEAIAVTDHADAGLVDRLVAEVAPACQAARRAWDLTALPGVEVTHVPPDDLADVVTKARSAGAAVVVVHGETPVEPVPEGTNAAAAALDDVDVLAHPGLVTADVAALAAEHDVALEISSRRGHGLANGHVAEAARQAGAPLVVDADAHAPTDLIDQAFALRVARGAGLTGEEAFAALVETPRGIVERALKRLG